MSGVDDSKGVPGTDLERRAALARELTWLTGMLPLGVSGESTEITDDRVAAIVATALLALPSEATDEAVDRALAAVGLQRGVDRAIYYHLEQATNVLVLTNEWHSPGLRGMKAIPAFARLGLDLLPASFQSTLRQGTVLRLPQTHRFLSRSVEEIVEPEGDRALAMAPVVVNGTLIGVAALSAAVGSTWGDEDLELLQVVAQGIARAVERRRVDAALQASEVRFRTMCEASPLGIFLAAPNGECLYVNPAGQRITGLTEADARGSGWIKALHPEDRQRVSSRWSSAVASREGYETPAHRFIRADGSVRSVEVHAAPLAGPSGEQGFLGILEDVTDRLRAEGERRELFTRAQTARAEAEVAREEAETARAEVANILSRVSDAIMALDLEGRYTYVNDRALAMIGRTREQIIGQLAWSAFPQAAGGRVHQAFLEAVTTERATTVEAQGIVPGRWYEVRIYPSRTGVSIFFEDISERKRQEEQLRGDREYLRQELGGLEVFSEIVGLDPALRRMMDRVALVAGTSTNVLVTGETGTGKELVARALHEGSPRRDRLLVKVNCAAISAGLVESELFGHEKGAFTGALQRRKGRFELAHGGTLFLDEIGELPMEMQVKLLRVLQEREFERVGGTETVRVDVRVVAATNRDLPEMVAAGKFREDLYYRLAVFPVTLPPLRARANDIPLLVHSFLRRFARQAGRRIEDISPQAMHRLVTYQWPGNVRELQNVIERAVILATGTVLDLEALPDLTVSEPPAPMSVVAKLNVPGSPSEPSNGFRTSRDGLGRGKLDLPPVHRTIEEVERGYVAEVLAETAWVIEGEHGAARRLGLHPNTLRSRLKRWGLTRPPPLAQRA